MRLEALSVPGLRRLLWEPRALVFLLVLILAGCQTAEWQLGLPSELWWFWLFAVGVAHRILSWRATLLFSLAGALVANAAGLWGGQPDTILRFTIMLVVFAGASLGLGQALRERDRAVVALEQAGASCKACQEEGARFRALIDSSGVGILTVSAQGNILTANDAAHRMLGFADDKLAGRFITTYLPPLGGLLRVHGEGNSFRSAMECRAWRRDGQVINAQVCFSTFRGPSGSELAVLFNDSTVWAPEGDSFPLNDTRRLAQLSACADLHEIRNLSFAIEALCHDLLSRPASQQRRLQESLQYLARGLGRLSGRELRPQAEGGMTRLELDKFACEVKTVLERFFQGSGIELEWKVPQGLPAAWADPEGLLQVFLNLAKNSLGASDPHSAPKVVSIGATEGHGRVFLHYRDNGAGPDNSEELFRPILRGPDVMKLGLYISRALLHSFGGDLRSVRDTGRMCFVLELLTAEGADRTQSSATLTA